MRLIGVVLGLASLYSASVVAYCVIHGSRGSTPGIYWSAVALIGLIGCGCALGRVGTVAVTPIYQSLGTKEEKRA